MSTTIPRRQFLAQGAALVTAAGLPGPTPHLRRRRARGRPTGLATGLHIEGVPESLAPLDAVSASLGLISVVSWYQAWGDVGRGPVHPEWFDAVRNSRRLGMITWEPWYYNDHPWDGWRPADIAAGLHDPYITAWADAFARRGDGPWYVRPMHEMNGNWYPWGGVAPADYRAAWVHICDLFARRGVTNVRWVWCPLVDDVAGPFEPYYPGHRYVDVLALDGYNWGSTRPENGGWRSPSAVFDAAYRRLIALGLRQPVWLAEVGCAPEGGDKAAWVSELYRLCRTDWRRISAVTWFSLAKEEDWRVEADPAVAAAVKAR